MMNPTDEGNQRHEDVNSIIDDMIDTIKRLTNSNNGRAREIINSLQELKIMLGTESK